MNNKRGFNLIEIAIVLAVIGLVIGGIYVAASAVTSNNRLQQTQKQVLQIISNVRTVYATQPTFVAPTYAQIKAMKLYPGDLADTGVTFLNAYGGEVLLYDPAGGSNGTNQQFYLSFYGVPKDACIKLLTQGFGSGQQVTQSGLYTVGVHPNFMAQTDVADGVSVAEATALCQNSSPFGPAGTNEVVYVMNIRG